MAVKLEAGEVDLRNVSDADAQLLLEFSMEGQARPSTPAANPRVSIPALLNELESRHATKSMSISVEPEPQAIKQPKLGKGRGRVTRGPKKRQGKGWIIESCTTSGVASPEPDLPFLDPDLFGSDSDLTDIESEDPLAGLPPVPISSGSEYEPRVAGDSQVDYEGRSILLLRIPLISVLQIPE
ncbi:Jumonji domain-containing protein 1 [Ceratobasidium theobromae]|uniref:Jumonji domain-containing protein 1 n=1 Tax=Ceratobasidium theobromae TaxID=1582974 RepID=A0A5N5QB03_9AGAM|nr:Jumonji domain-containing protein 1 [Ceratobasidium theobromae]